MGVQRVLLLGFCGLWMSATVFAGSKPVAVSPGDASNLALVESRCPTFSWGAVPGAVAYELLIFHLGELERTEQVRPGLRTSIPGTALGWTPALDRCLERGEAYAWSVRAETDRHWTDWADPSLFRVSAVPSSGQIDVVLRAIQGTLEEEGAKSDGFLPATPMPAPTVLAALRRPQPAKEVLAPTDVWYGIKSDLLETTGKSFAISGSAQSQTSQSAGVYGYSATAEWAITYGVAGSCNAANGWCTGVYGSNPSGHGVYGRGRVGILGISDSATGYGSVFLNSGGGDLIVAEGSPSLSVPTFTVDNGGNVLATSFSGIGSGLLDLPLTITKRSGTSLTDTTFLESPSCDEGGLLTGGGCSCPAAELRDSRPSDSATPPVRWQCRCGSSVRITAEAICLQIPQSP